MGKLRRFAVHALALSALLASGLPQRAGASSHREAPLISLDPTADNTDVYAFRSPDKPDTVTFVANYIPLEEPNGGPNFNKLDDTVLYEIHVDNNGDAKDDITYQFRFKTTVLDPTTYQYSTGPILSLDDPHFNIRQSYSVTRIVGGKAQLLGDNLPTPPVNIGPRSTPNYAALAATAVRPLAGGSTVFVGQRDDAFFVDLGAVFDLAGLRPFNPAHVIPLPVAPGMDGVGGFNTHSIELQVPINQLTRAGTTPSGPSDPSAVIGVYASASRQKIRVLSDDGTSESHGPFQQVSRLGNPLINEVVIHLGQKDFWNAQDPANDRQFLPNYLTPEVSRLEQQYYPTVITPQTNRQDLVKVLLTGLPGLNYTGPTPADLLRLNMAIAPTAPVGAGNPLGVLDGDLAGFPNGRRLEDDTVDIELRAFAGGYTLTPAFNHAPNNVLGDGVDRNDMPFLSAFPYLATPHQGYEHTHHQLGSPAPRP
jgi:hypothetical protein